MIKEWEKREVIKQGDALNNTTILNCIAGMKHEKPYVRVFLRHKDEKADKFFKEHCSVSEDTVIEFINVAEMFKNIEEERKEDTEMFAIDCDTRKKMSSTIKTEGKN